jgi:hypothetical protein
MTECLAGSAAAGPLSMRAAACLSSGAVRATRQLLTDLERGRRIDTKVLRSAMEAAFGASDAAGAGNWKTAYEACEAATVLFRRKFGLPPIRTFLNRLSALTIDLRNILFTKQLLSARIEGAVASGTYDVELETLRAGSFVVMLDDGEIERRVRPIRPMEQHKLPLTPMAERHLAEADRERFAAAWVAELAKVPEFTKSTIHVEAGLLLPIWKRLPNESTRICRLQTNGGERIIGRKVSATWVANVLAADTPLPTPDAAFAALMEGRTVLELAEGLQLWRVQVMSVYRIELSGFNDAVRDRLRTYGLFGEIISWKPGMFVPMDASGVGLLSRVLDRYPVERIVDREAA